jgi:hypothetical protein
LNFFGSEDNRAQPPIRDSTGMNAAISQGTERVMSLSEWLANARLHLTDKKIPNQQKKEEHRC